MDYWLFFSIATVIVVVGTIMVTLVLNHYGLIDWHPANPLVPHGRVSSVPRGPELDDDTRLFPYGSNGPPF